jgi:integrase
MQPAKLYSEPQICPKNPQPGDIKKTWFVNFRFYDVAAQKWVPRHEKKGINKFKKYKERLAEANSLKEAIADALRQGWNPLTGNYAAGDPLGDIEEATTMTFAQAVTFALGKCSTAPRTYSNYKNSAERIMKESRNVVIPGSSKSFDFASLPITGIQKKHIKYLLDHCRQSLSWSNKAFNKNMGYFRAVLSRLEEYEVIAGNPASRIKELPVNETHKFIPYTEDEKKTIREHLYLNRYGLFIILMMTYHTGMRPNEVLALKRSDVDLTKRIISIVPETSRDNSKTKNIRIVPLCDELYFLLKEWLKDMVPAEYYVFGSPFTSGRGNSGSSKTGRGVTHPDYFRPSFTRIKRDTITKLWKKIVIDDLKINKHLYAGKHTGADDKIMAGIDLEALKELYGHSSKFMTMNYVTKLKEIHHKQIKALSPEFSK